MKKKRHWIHTIYIHIISIQWYVLFLFFSQILVQFKLAFVYYKSIVEIHGEWDNTVFLDEKERKKQMLTINLMWLCVRACAHCGQGSLFVMIIFYRILCWITHSLWSFYCTLFGKMLAIYRLIFFFRQNVEIGFTKREPFEW